MTLFHYNYAQMRNISNFVSIIDIDFIHYAGEEWACRASTQPHINNIPAEHVGFWTMDELKVCWDDNTCNVYKHWHPNLLLVHPNANYCNKVW